MSRPAQPIPNSSNWAYQFKIPQSDKSVHSIFFLEDSSRDVIHTFELPGTGKCSISVGQWFNLAQNNLLIKLVRLYKGNDPKLTRVFNIDTHGKEINIESCKKLVEHTFNMEIAAYLRDNPEMNGPDNQNRYPVRYCMKCSRKLRQDG